MFHLFSYIAIAGLIAFLIHNLIAARQTANDAEARIRATSDLVPFGVWKADAAGNLTYFGDAFLKLLGKTEGEVRSWADVLSSSQGSAADRMWRESVKSGSPWDHEFVIQDLQGASYSILSRGVPIRGSNGRVISWVGVNLDVTERYRSERERQRQSEDLSRSNAELEQFAHIASHDLQEPLRMIVGYLQLLERRYKGRLDSDADEFIHFAVDGAARLQRLINGLLEFSRACTRHLHRTPTDLEEVVKTAVSNLSRQLRESLGEVTWANLPMVEADQDQFAQLFQNLIGNAVKFRNEQPPRIHVSARREGAFWEFSITDNGIGIEEKYADHIFLIFRRLHTSRYPGTGVGLAISKRIVERHGGRMWFEPEAGGGTTFKFTLPAWSDGADLKTAP